jgi:hypothetical protein
VKIDFRKISKQPKDFELQEGSLEFAGTIKKKSTSLVTLQGTLQGTITIDCDVCTKAYALDVDEEIVLDISDGISKECDMEFLGGVIDFSEILHSEMESIKSDYCICDDCIDEEFEQEF